MAISDKLDYLIETKSKLKDSLNSLGAEITASTTFRNYLNWLDSFYDDVSTKTNLTTDGIVGRTSQSGTPTPENPLEIKNLSGDVKYRVRGQGISEIFPLSLKSKNLFDGIFRQGLHTSTTTANRLASTNAMKSTKNKYYTFSTNLPNTFGYKIMNDTSNSLDATVVDDTSYTSSGKVTVKCTTDGYLKLLIKKTDGSNLTVSDISGYKFQIEEGSTSTTYEPYYDIELCEISSYKDKIYSNNGRFYLEKNTNKIILNGDELIDMFSVTGGKLFRCRDIAISVPDTSPVSNYFKGVPNSSSRYDGTVYYNYNASADRMVFDILTTKFTTVSKFKSWLSTHNTELQFAIPTSTTTEITANNYPSLYNALKQIQDYLVSYKINKEFLLDYSSPEIEY